MSSPSEPLAPGVVLRHQRRFRRWALRLFASHVLLGAATLVVLMATIATGTAGRLVLVLGGLLTAIALPVWIVTMVLAIVSLVRREPRPLIAVGLLVICLLLALVIAPIGLGMLRDAVEAFG